MTIINLNEKNESNSQEQNQYSQSSNKSPKAKLLIEALKNNLFHHRHNKDDGGSNNTHETENCQQTLSFYQKFKLKISNLIELKLLYESLKRKFLYHYHHRDENSSNNTQPQPGPKSLPFYKQINLKEYSTKGKLIYEEIKCKLLRTIKTKFLPAYKKIKIKIDLTIESIFPSKHQLSDKRLQNRMKICILAVCLMWATSLKVAVYVSTIAIRVPPFQLIYSSCKSAFQVASQEKRKYAKCVRMQLDQCTDKINRATITELRRVNISSNINTEIVNSVKATYDTCSSDYMSVRFSLEDWIDAGQSVPLNNITCTDEDREAIMSTLGDISVVKSKSMAISEEYSMNIEGTLKRLTTYAKVRATYDQDYLHNRTEFVRRDVKAFLQYMAGELPDPDINLDSVFRDLVGGFDAMLICISPKRGNCTLIDMSFLDHIDAVQSGYTKVILDLQKRAIAAREKFEQYKRNISCIKKFIFKS